MIRTVLLPAEIKDRFSTIHTPRLEPLYYRLHPERLLYRVQRKLGWRDAKQSLHSRIEILYQPDRLEHVEAVWLSDKVTLPNYLLEVLLDKMPRLRWVYWQRSGTDNLDLSSFSRRNIVLSNSGNLVSHYVAEMNLACILAHAKKLPEHYTLQHKHEYRSVYCDQIAGQTVGILGTGNIGRETARLCMPLGMRVVVASRNPAHLDNVSPPFNHVYHLNEELDRLLEESDYIIIAIPLNVSTQNLFGKKQFQSMRNTAALINTARYGIVDETELIHALDNNQIAAAYIDPPFNRRVFFWDKVYRTKNLYLTHNSSANFRNKSYNALKRFIHGIEQEDITGSFPDMVI